MRWSCFEKKGSCFDNGGNDERSIRETGAAEYHEQFRRDALQLIDNGQSVVSVSRALGVSAKLLHQWKKERQSQGPTLEIEMAEKAELQARLREAEQERDILKKALDFFSRPR